MVKKGVPFRKAGRTFEIWLCNVGSFVQFNDLGYKSKRMGKRAYDEDGNEMKGLYPVYVTKREYGRPFA